MKNIVLRAINNNADPCYFQYERWQPRARYRQSLDPTVEEIRRLATGLRRNARDERVLFHYNGHGVPKPTGTTWEQTSLVLGSHLAKRLKPQSQIVKNSLDFNVKI